MYGFGFTLTQSNRIRFTEAPVNTIAPRIPATSNTGRTIKCEIGSWDYGTSQPSFAWYKDDEVIEGERGQELFIDRSWSGVVIYCEVGLCNVYGCGSATSNNCTVL